MGLGSIGGRSRCVAAAFTLLAICTTGPASARNRVFTTSPLTASVVAWEPETRTQREILLGFAPGAIASHGDRIFVAEGAAIHLYDSAGAKVGTIGSVKQRFPSSPEEILLGSDERTLFVSDAEGALHAIDSQTLAVVDSLALDFGSAASGPAGEMTRCAGSMLCVTLSACRLAIVRESPLEIVRVVEFADNSPSSHCGPRLYSLIPGGSQEEVFAVSAETRAMRIDLARGAAQVVVEVGDGDVDHLSRLAYDPHRGRLYAALHANLAESDEAHVIAYDAATGAERARVRLPGDGIRDIEISPDGRFAVVTQFAAPSSEETVYSHSRCADVRAFLTILDLEALEVVDVIDSPDIGLAESRDAGELALSSDGRLAAVTHSMANSIRVVDLDRRQLVNRLPMQRPGRSVVVEVPDATPKLPDPQDEFPPELDSLPFDMAFAGTYDPFLILVDADGIRVVRFEPCPTNPSPSESNTYALALVPNRDVALLSRERFSFGDDRGDDYLLTFVDTKSGEVRTEIEVAARVGQIVVRPDGDEAYAASEEGILVVDVEYATVTEVLPYRSATLGLAPTGETLYAWDDDGIAVIDTRTREQVRSLPAESGRSRSLSVTSSGNALYLAHLYAGSRSRVLVIDAASGAELRRLEFGADISGVSAGAGDRVYVTVDARQVWSVDTKTHSILGSVEPSPSDRYFDDLAVSPDGQSLVVGRGYRGVVSDTATGQIVASSNLLSDTGRVAVRCRPPDCPSIPTPRPAWTPLATVTPRPTSAPTLTAMATPILASPTPTATHASKGSGCQVSAARGQGGIVWLLSLAVPLVAAGLIGRISCAIRHNTEYRT